MADQPNLNRSRRHPEAKAPAEAAPVTNPTWERVQLARHPKRPHASDYISRIFTGFSELHGDRFLATTRR
jgi:acetyl-CoA carboxylase carboxyl transferase subunit alpha